MTEPAIGDEPEGPSHWPRELDTDYELVGELGRGGMAVVFRARDRALGREVAIKVVRPRFAADEEAVARLAREARTVAQLEHPNIVGVYSIRNLSDRSVALVMQLVPGRTLKAALAEGHFPVSRVEHVLRDIGRALTYAHKSGVVHRDVKPENIFLDDVSGRVMLSDFGVARVMDAPTELTATGTTIGTPTYMAPEQIDGGEIDGRSDLYSLGMVGWEMLTGERPWMGDSLYSVIYHQKHDPLPPIDAYREDVPPRLLYLVDGLLQKNPDRRWNSAARFLTLLSSDHALPGLREWQAAQWRRRRSSSFRAAKARTDATAAAASGTLDTMKFERGVTPESSKSMPPTTPVSPDAPESFTFPVDRETQPEASPATRQFADLVAAMERPRTPVEQVAEEEVPPFLSDSEKKRLLIVGAGVLALTVFMLVWQMRSVVRPTAPEATASSTTLTDRPGIELPVMPAAIVGRPLDSVVPSPPAAARGDTTGAVPNESVVRALVPPSAGKESAGKSVKRSAKELAALRADSLRAAAAATARAPAAKDAGSTRQRGAEETPATGRGNQRGGDSARTSGSAPSTPVVAPAVTAPAPAPSPAPSSAVSFPNERATIAAGGFHSCMILAGRASCWGNNEFGQVGDGTFEVRSTPTRVAGDFSFAQISAGGRHTCGLTNGGDIYCWGQNESGQLGDGTTSVRAAPVRVAGDAAFKIVRTGQNHSCALARDGTVYCWGSNASGQLGDGSRSIRTSPVRVSLPAAAAAVAVGSSHSCALTTDGVAYCWGRGNDGQLGDGARAERGTPVAVETSLRFMSIATGLGHTCAVSVGNQAFCWGRNNYGQLGTGETGSVSVPQAVAGGTSFLTIVAGSGHTCARAEDGRSWCWGRNAYGQLGDGTTVDRTRPVAVRGVGSVSALHASGSHTCAMTSAGDAYCWGYNIDGQLGGGDHENASSPARVAPPR